MELIHHSPMWLLSTEGRTPPPLQWKYSTDWNKNERMAHTAQYQAQQRYVPTNNSSVCLTSVVCMPSSYARAGVMHANKHCIQDASLNRLC